MEQIRDYDTLSERIADGKFVLYVMAHGCTVCHADLPKVEALLERYDVDHAKIMINEIPEAAGQLSLYASPVVILFDSGREFHRQARIINFEELEYRMEQFVG